MPTLTPRAVVTAQGMDDQALEVLKAAKSMEELLAGKVEALAAARGGYERKQNEVLPLPAHAVDERALQGMRSWGRLQNLLHASPLRSLEHYGLLLGGSLMQALLQLESSALQGCDTRLGNCSWTSSVRQRSTSPAQ